MSCSSSLAREKAVETLQVKYLNNILEQPSHGLQANYEKVTDHRFIKRITVPMTCFKAFYSAQATIVGIGAVYMIRKRLVPANRLTARQQFTELAAQCPKLGRR